MSPPNGSKCRLQKPKRTSFPDPSKRPKTGPNRAHLFNNLKAIFAPPSRSPFLHASTPPETFFGCSIRTLLSRTFRQLGSFSARRRPPPSDHHAYSPLRRREQYNPAADLEREQRDRLLDRLKRSVRGCRRSHAGLPPTLLMSKEQLIFLKKEHNSKSRAPDDTTFVWP